MALAGPTEETVAGEINGFVQKISPLRLLPLQGICLLHILWKMVREHDI